METPTVDELAQVLSWERLHDLAEQYGDAYYILDIQAFRTNYHELLDAFRQYYPHTNIGYSYKTNYIPQICQYVNSAGGYAEVVSWMEYELALSVGVPSERIIFNGPYKTEANIEQALCGGSIVNLDGLYEVDYVEAVAARHPDTLLTVGIRCNFDIGDDRISRLGFDVEGADFTVALARLAALPNCTIGGLHCHYSTGHRSVDSYALRARTLIELTHTHFATPPRYVDVGGGFFSKMSPAMRAQFGGDIPTYADYAAAIAPQMAAAFPDGAPELLIEPGAAITTDVLHYVARIVHVKQVRGRTIALASGSIHNIKPTLHSKNMPVTVYCSPDNDPDDAAAPSVDLVGYTCMEHDVLHSGYSGAVQAGDYAVFDNLGAYTVVMQPPFIRAAPPMLVYDATDDSFALIRRQQELADVFAAYHYK